MAVKQQTARLGNQSTEIRVKTISNHCLSDIEKVGIAAVQTAVRTLDPHKGYDVAPKGFPSV
jgi:hypothetical protein